jgi:hypothetical protein
LENLLRIGCGVEVDLADGMGRLAQVARALNDGELGLAAIALVQAKLPTPLDPILADRMAKADGVAKYNADQPRSPAGAPDGGRWTIDQADRSADYNRNSVADSPSSLLLPAADPIDATVAKKQEFVATYQLALGRAAKQLNVPVENLLGIAALESNWGKSRFASKGFNIFGMQYPAPFAVGYIQASRSSKDGIFARLAKYKNVDDCVSSFVQHFGPLIRGTKDPIQFMTKLQDRAHFGYNMDTLRPDPDYVSNAAATIRGIRRLLTRGAV